MPRAKKRAYTPAGRTVTLAETLEQLPVAAQIREAAEVHPIDGHPESERFARQMEPDQAVMTDAEARQLLADHSDAFDATPLPPAPTQPESHGRKSWAQTVREHESYGRTGIHRVTFKVPVGDHGQLELTGIKFPDDRPPDTKETEFMQHTIKEIYGLKKGMGYYGALGVKAWGMPRSHVNEDITEEVTKFIAQGRQEQERGR